MRLNVLFTITLILIMPFYGFAQEFLLGIRASVKDYFSPSYPSSTWGIEVKPIKNLGLIFDYGTLIDEPYDFDGEYVNSGKFEGELVSGNKFALESRYYFELDDYQNIYLGVHYGKRYTIINDRYVIGYQCSTIDFSECTYYSDFTGELQTWFETITLSFGLALSPIQSVKHLRLNIGGTLGRSSSWLDRSTINGGYLVDDSRFLSENDFNVNSFASVELNIVYFFAF